LLTSKYTSRFAVVGTTVALAAGTVLVATPSADAAVKSVKSGYTCSTDFGDQKFDITTKMDLPAKVKKGKTVPGKSVKLVAVISSDTADLLRTIQVKYISVTADKTVAHAGKTKIPVAGVHSPKTKVPASGGFTVTSKGKAADFSIKKPGSYAVKIPTKFLFTITQYTDAQPDGSPLLQDAPCSVDKGEPTKISTLKVTK
jgi:hypothetical protein